MNDYKGKTPEGYSNCPSTHLVSGEPIGDSLRQYRKEECNYRLPKDPTFTDRFKGY